MGDYKGNLSWDIEADKFRQGLQESQALLNISLNVKRLRERAGITQRELAKRCQNSHPSIVRIERPSPDGLTINTLSRLASALGVLIVDLINTPRENYTPTFTFRAHFPPKPIKRKTK
jgi:transcriptional regulator with XRE-family HTH domain